jgi:ribosomal protein S18 acetylase RimI-like enzyme
MVIYKFIDTPNPDQVKQIVDLYLMEDWWDLDVESYDIVNKIIQGSHCFLAAIDEGRIIGMGRAISDKASDAYIQDVTVHNDYRRQGIGTEIIKAIISRLHNDGLGWIGLIAEKGSHDFYARLGFIRMPDSMPMLLKREP